MSSCSLRPLPGLVFGVVTGHAAPIVMSRRIPFARAASSDVVSAVRCSGLAHASPPPPSAPPKAASAPPKPAAAKPLTSEVNSLGTSGAWSPHHQRVFGLASFGGCANGNASACADAADISAASATNAVAILPIPSRTQQNTNELVKDQPEGA